MSESSFRLAVYPESRFGGFSDVDGTIRLYMRVNALIEPTSVVLDAGCGRGAYADDDVPFRRSLRNLRGKCKRVIGIDVDDAGAANPFLDEFRLIEGDRWPIEEASVDLCLCDHVLEHVPNPDSFFAECARVLKPGGLFCARTPNGYGYVSLLSRCIPNGWHRRVLAKIGKRRPAEDTFPTVYRCNTAGKVRRLLRRHGFEGHVWQIDDEPTYLIFSSAVYRFGAMIHRIIPPSFRASLLVVARKLP